MCQHVLCAQAPRLMSNVCCVDCLFSSLHVTVVDVSGTLSNIKLNSLFLFLLLYFIYLRLEIKVQVPRVPDVCVYHVHIYSTITYTHEASNTHSVRSFF